MLGGDRTWSSELPMKGSQTSHCSPASQALLVVLQDGTYPFSYILITFYFFLRWPLLVLTWLLS